MKEVKKLTKGDEAMRKEKIAKALVELGFVDLEKEEAFNLFGRLYWDIYYSEFKAVIEPVWKRKQFETFYTEGLQKVMEIPVFGYYTEIYRAVLYKVYLIHISTGPYNRYWRVWIYDNANLEQIAQIELSEGFLYLGDQDDLGKMLPKLFKILDPAKIKIY